MPQACQSRITHMRENPCWIFGQCSKMAAAAAATVLREIQGCGEPQGWPPIKKLQCNREAGVAGRRPTMVALGFLQTLTSAFSSPCLNGATCGRPSTLLHMLMPSQPPRGHMCEIGTAVSASANVTNCCTHSSSPHPSLLTTGSRPWLDSPNPRSIQAATSGATTEKSASLTYPSLAVPLQKPSSGAALADLTAEEPGRPGQSVFWKVGPRGNFQTLTSSRSARCHQQSWCLHQTKKIES